MAALSAAALAIPADALALDSFRRDGDPDDTLALKRAMERGRPIHVRAGRGGGAGGRYVVGMNEHDNLPQGLTMFGDGRDRSILHLAPGAPFILHGDSKSADPARNLSGMRFSDLAFTDDVARLGFSEYLYLVMLSGVSDARFERVAFRGFRGDGLHLGSSTVSKIERHNVDVLVRDCVFDGVNSNNRNAISIIDCDGLTVERSKFLNCTRAGDGTANVGDPMNPLTGVAMPGPIDFEPNGDAFARIRRIVIRDNLFRGGGGYAVSLALVANNRVTVPQSDILITDNVIEDRAGGVVATGYQGADAMKPGPGYGIRVVGNTIRHCARPFTFSGMKTVAVTGNVIADCTDRAEIGNIADVDDIVLRGNRFERIGSEIVPFALWVRGSSGVRLIGNDFTDAGGPHGKEGTAVAFVGGVTRGVTMTGNSFAARTRRMTKAVMVFRDGAVDPASLKVADNVVHFAAPRIEDVLLRRA